MHIPDLAVPSDKSTSAFPLVYALAVCVTLLACARVDAQGLEPTPEFGEVGREVEITVTSRQGEPLNGVAVETLSPAGDDERLGTTDAAGIVRFRPQVPGNYELRALVDGGRLLLITPYEVRPQRDRWVWGLASIPVGLVLLWLNVRRRGRTSRA